MPRLPHSTTDLAGTGTALADLPFANRLLLEVSSVAGQDEDI